MSDSQTPWHDPNQGPSTGCATVLLVVLGLVMLVPGVCAIIFITNRPGQLFAQGAGVLWSFLLIGAGGIVLIVLAARLSTRR
jgi:hypothetical protein